MSEEQSEITQVVRVDDKDWFLQSLINMVNSGTFSFGVTLSVSGFLVSGQLIGGKEYFDGFAGDFTSGFSDSEAAEQIKNSFTRYVSGPV